MRLPLLAAPLLLALSACSTGGPDATSTPPAPTQNAAPLPAATTLAPAPTGITGKWTSPSCGARTYERRISFEADGSFIAEDRVSPCPPSVVCVWAGIVFRRGKYAPSPGTIQLTIEGPNGTPGQPIPTTLAVEPSGAPAEVLDGGERCTYARMR